jgi:hypothetical protein
VKNLSAFLAVAGVSFVVQTSLLEVDVENKGKGNNEVENVN